MVVAAEQAAEIGGIHVALPGHLGLRPQPQMLRLDVLPATLIGGEGRRLGRLPRHQTLGNLQNQVLQQHFTDPRAEARPFHAVEDQVVENPLDLAGGEDAHHAPRRQCVLPQQPRGARPVKSTKYFTSGSAVSVVMSWATPGP